MLEMLNKHLLAKEKNKRKPMIFGHKMTPIIFLLSLLFLISEINGSSSCTEQWTELDMSKSEWTAVDDAVIKDNTDGTKTFEFGTEEKIAGDLGGAVWNNYDFTKKRGILISFKPTITMDPLVYGNQKLPQGFAIVITSSSTNKLIGAKAGGIGYEGIQNAIAFEFDFYRDSDKNDYNDPHFSVHYKINGEISANSLGCKTLCNIPLPNFYDSDQDLYISNIVYEIAIVGRKLTVKSNHGTLLDGVDFGAFTELVEQEEISIGITASMNQNKKVTIDNFKVSEIFAKEKGDLALKTTGAISAGNSVALYYSLTSTCGEPLKVYYKEYTGVNFTLIINGNEVEPESRTFDDSKNEVKLTISESKVDTYTALVKFNGHLSTPTEFTIKAGSIQRFELCPSVKQEKFKIVSKLEQSGDTFNVPICSYDQYGNPKTFSSFTFKIKIQYPSNLVPDIAEEYEFSEDKMSMNLKVSVSIFGTYEFFSENFIDQQIRSYELMPTSISPEKSVVGILYEDRIISSDTTSVSLRMQLKDNNGRTVPKYMIELLKCNFDSSYVLIDSTKKTGLTLSYLNDDNALLTFKGISSSGKYTFVPIVQCTGITSTELKCEIDSDTKESKCEFYKESKDIDKSSVLAYSDFLDKYFLFQGTKTTTPLVLSIDEYENGKLTDLILVDTYGAIKHAKVDVSITAKIDSNALTVTQVGNKFALSYTSRKSFNPAKSYTITLSGGLSDISIPVKFYSKNKYLSNIYLTDSSSTGSYIAFYKQDSFSIKASENILLFDIFEYVAGQTLGDGKNLDISQAKLQVNSQSVDSASVSIVKNGAFISVSTSALTKAGSYKVSVNYGAKVLSTVNIEIEPQDTVTQLGDDTGAKLPSTDVSIGAEQTIRLTLLDKYENVLTNKQLFKAYSSIKVTISSHSMTVRPNYDGKISVIYRGRSKSDSVSFLLLNSKKYTVKSSVTTDAFTDFDPYRSYGILVSGFNLTAQDTVSLTLFLQDKFGNQLTTKTDNNAIKIYAQGKNSKEVVQLTTSQTSSSVLGMSYYGTVTVEGDYEIKIFVNDYPVECKGCNFKVNRIINTGTSDAYKNVRMYLLGNKKKVPVFNSESKPQIVDKRKYLNFYLQFMDKYNNEFSVTKTYSLYLENKSVKVQICPYGSKAEDKGYYKICSDAETKYNALDDGAYYVKVEGKYFYFYLTSNYALDQSDKVPVSSNSMIMQYDNIIYGKTNAPGFFTLDLRTKNYKRMSTIDKTKITVTGSDLSIKVYNGPENGLVTVFLNAKAPGKYTFGINYNNVALNSDQYTYVCGCSVRSLSFDKIVSTETGYYAFYKALDHNGNSCASTYSWNELDEKDTYAHLAITASQTGDDTKVYKPKIAFNHLTGVVSLFFDNHVFGTLNMKSSIVTFDTKSSTLTIPSKVIDKDHFYATLDKSAKEIKLTLLNDNFEKISMTGLNYKDFNCAVVRQLNDDIVTIKTDYKASSADFTIAYDSPLVDAVGKYLFVVYYKGEEIFCENCMLEVTTNEVNIQNTKVYHKEGNNIYYADTPDAISPLYKSNFPFLKINLFTDSGNLVTLTATTGLTVSLKAGSTTIETNIYNSNTGNIYLYLTETGRKTYASIAPMTILKLSITYSSQTFEIEYVLLNSYLEEPSSTENCYKGAEVTIVNQQASYISRADSKIELEVYLNGCRENQMQIQDSPSFGLKVGEDTGSVEAIPTDIYGGYILFIGFTKAASVAKNAYITYKSAQSSTFKLTVNPGYAISSVSFSTDDYLSGPSSDSKYVYVLAEMTDSESNKITNMGRNLFAADYFNLKVTDANSRTLPYKISYNEGLNKLVVQIPVSGAGTITVAGSKSQQVTVQEGKYYVNSLFVATEKTNTYSFTLSARDSFYNKITTAKNIEKIGFRYFTINPMTEEVFTKEFVVTGESGTYSVELDTKYPRYQIYGFVPLINSIPQDCSTCLYKNALPDYIYTVDNMNYLPHKLSRKLYFIKDLESPLLIYSSESSVDPTETGLTKEKMVTTGTTSLYAFYYSGTDSTLSIQVKSGSSTLTFNSELLDYASEAGTRNTAPGLSERYGLNSYLNNKGDLATVSFFIETRTEEGKLIKMIPSLYTSSTDSPIKSLNVYSTNIDGVFFVYVTFAKSGNTEYTLKYTTEAETTNDKQYNTFQINELASFPVTMVLNNKKILGNNVLRYDIIATNADSEEICDDRLNIYPSIITRLGFKLLYHDGKSCKLLLQFSGDLSLESTIGKFSSELTNDDSTIYNVNPHTSSLTVSPNVFDSISTELSINFIERSSFNFNFETDEKTTSKQLDVFKYSTPTQYELVNSMKGLYSTSYAISAGSFDVETGATYAFVGAIGDNSIYPVLVNYNVKSSETPTKFDVEVVDNFGATTKITNLLEKRMNSGSGLELIYPFSLRFKVLNAYNTPINLSASDLSKIKARIIAGSLTAATTEEFTINLFVRQISDKTYSAEISTDDVRTVLHTPVVNAKSYYLELLYSTKKYTSYLASPKDTYQSPNVRSDSRQYAYLTDTTEMTDVHVLTEKKSTEVYYPSNAATIQHVCVVANASNGQIINGHVDITKLEITSNSNDCTVSFMNSYLGCVAMSFKCSTVPTSPVVLNVKYKGLSNQSRLTAKVFPAVSPVFANVKSKAESYVSSAAMYILFTMTSESNAVSELSNNYLSVFVNGERLNNKQYSLSVEENVFSLSLQTSYSNTVPKKKQVMVAYDDGVNPKVYLAKTPTEITITQPDYKFSAGSRTWNYKVQVPITLKVGDKLYLYLLVKDTDHACYFGPEKNLENIKAKIVIDSNSYASKRLTPTSLTGISSCEKTYLLEFDDASKIAGDFPITIMDGSGEITTGEYTIYINNGELDASSCNLSEGENVKAGSRFEIYFTGTDSYGNKPNYFDIAEYLDIDFVDTKTKKITEVDKKATAAVDNSKVIFGCTIQSTGTYDIKLYYKGAELKGFTGTQQTVVSYGECSLKDANPQIVDIDGRTTVFYSGEQIQIHLQCKDELGNDISSRGSEVFTANIKLEETETGISYDLSFISGKYYFTFTPAANGKYTADISLNGKKYGQTISFEVKTYDYNKYMCMDKRQFDKIEQCENEKYNKFVEDLLGKNYVCARISNGEVFVCPVSGKCVANTVDCPCEGKSYNGYCYPQGTNPFAKLDDSKVTCVSQMMTDGGYDAIIKCFDGTCRTSQEECDTKFECPVGYKSCADRCILMNEECKITNECSSNQVLCWDLSCAEDYSQCPTRISCPHGKVLCPDKTCRASGHCAQPNERFCPEGEIQCPDFSCVKAQNDCGKNIVCEAGESLCQDGGCRLSCEDVVVPEGKYRCKSGAYVDNIQLCPTEVFQPDDYVKCSSGGIAKTKSECDYVQGGNKITCPKTKPVLCPDFECVEQSSDCNKNVPSCPTHKPYQCWNNECRISFDECPTPVTCPANTPVLCSSGICGTSSDDCQEVPSTKCTDYRCFDGTCVKSMELCPTHTYCGEDAIKCWNGACVSNIAECPSSIFETACSSKFPYRCPDGTCRPNRKSCTTMSVCPSSLPIKCFDNSCRANTDECPSFQSCGERKVSCPDGTCAKTISECNTGITCFSDKPFLCYDGSCAKELSECPEPPFCQKNQVLCPNGACASSRQNCKIFDPCSSDEPIRCEMNTCTETVDQCSTKQKRCPVGYTLCATGECKTSESLCNEFVCPKSKSYKCPEGVCVNNKYFCDNQENGCPYNAPNRCPDGSCVVSMKTCTEFVCEEGKKQCPDGSCILEKEECPTINGCYADRPYKCADGTCINPETTNCTMALCPFTKPIQCPNGNCVGKSSECSIELRQEDKDDCQKEGLVMCVDGRCVPSVDYCRPFYDCETGYTRCPDGSCRVSSDLCPANVQCPETRPIRCSNQICVASEADCLNGLICPSGYVRCMYNGACAKKQTDCPEAVKTKTGCPMGNQVKCANGRCLDSLIKCKASSNACPDDTSPYLCPNGECVDDKNNCKGSASSGNNICGAGKDLCQSGRCVPADNSSKRTQCTNTIGCPLNKPYRCSNGECVYRENYCSVNSISIYGQVISNIACDISKPYLCDDASCVSDYTFCKTNMPCDNGRTKCPNGFCVDNSKKCEEYLDLCPLSSPIKCPSGSCVSNIVDCAPSFNIPICEDGEFYCTRLAKCVTNKLDCFIYYDMSQVVSTSVTRRLFENFVDPFEKKKSTGEFISLAEEESEDKKGVLCYDGTVAGPGEKCPIVPGCKMGQYRCENGGCSYDKDKCKNETEFTCPSGQMKCPDGLCHEDCKVVAYHGCLVGQYQCSNGLCVKDEYACIGHSMCSNPEYPFRCIDGTCQESPSDCPLIKRLGDIQNMTYTFNRINTAHFSFALDNNRRTLATIEIPGNGLLINNSKSDAYGRLFIEEVSSSILFDSGLYNDSKAFLFNVSNSVKGSEGVLTFENSVMSPVFKFYTKDKGIKFNLTAVVTIIHNYYDASGINFTDYCLAKLNNFDLDKDAFTGEASERHWVCVQRKEYDEQQDFRISEFGVYAVILNPLRNKINYFGDSQEKNFFLENIKMILIVFGAIIVVLALIFYIFFRVTRYREKYHENRNKILLLQQQRQEYENMTTDIFGQTLGDNINGIVYKANPCYTITEEIKTKDTSLEEEIEKLQIQCKNVTDQNARLQGDIDELTDRYKILSNSIENMAK